ncbi:hypothetical protein [Okeania sp. SIO1F9]|uniref:hypothetical protein n=1 Tax=Okeania sp. SIO1F9 TaxID=2607813 RepID=UPI0013CA9CFB|nr:hypothetical protein [Okeania sp. SIO1F9]NEP79391.1 hypothetical protein [Okeania sp. SIO3B3]NER06335.1 hypothetical protein [Okeania sp. SIO3C4]NET79949.1 hypothetical protein [Okeania sp. SIO1F9]
MLFTILILDVALVAWSLHLMQQSFNHREFSLMLAGILVATSAAAMMVVYFLMGTCMSDLAQMSQHSYAYF